MRQVSSQWEWEEEKEAARAAAIEKHKLSLRRDYHWHRVGLLWEVRLAWLDDEGKVVYAERAVPKLFLRQKAAAKVSSAVFCAYLDGRSVQREADKSALPIG